jgi:hypothetical protein
MGVSSRTSATAAERGSAAEKFRTGLLKSRKTVVPKSKKSDREKKERKAAPQGKASRKPTRKR